MSVIDKLRKYVLVDGFHVVIDLDKSEGSWVVDAETGKRYLDCYSQFASQPFGWNYPAFVRKDLTRLQKAALHKLANSDMYSEIYCDFVEAFASITPDFKYYFFIEGGALGVENALKAAFDWKCQVDSRWPPSDGSPLDIIHLREAFHGRTGYTLSLTNTGALKTKWYPKFEWPRVLNPKIKFPLDVDVVAEAEEKSLYHMKNVLVGREGTAAIIMETIQGEGGDNHFRPEFFKAVRELADENQAMLILDEVQCGMGITGTWWAYEQMGVKPDMLCFGKKSQVCGFCSNERVEEAENHVFKQSGRINSTWGGNLVDMERARLIIEVIKERNLLEHVGRVGRYFLKSLQALDCEVTNVRGRGLMLAFDLPTPERRDEVLYNLHEKGMLALKCGHQSIRFRPALTFSEQDVEDAMYFVKEALN